ncbi:MAG: rod shape-determining protein MreD, partial [Alphaproteobacteria bacterium]|nr:rod shape-determining protein MreD [Alphaproteobacteria bacterium]
MLRSIQADQLLLQQVFSFVGLMFIIFVDSALGQLPTFYGSAPKLVFGVLFIIGIRFPKAVPLLPVMVLGLIYDLVQGNPFGYSSSIYLIILIFTQLRGVVLVEADATTQWSEFVLLVFGLML